MSSYVFCFPGFINAKLWEHLPTILFPPLNIFGEIVFVNLLLSVHDLSFNMFLPGGGGFSAFRHVEPASKHAIVTGVVSGAGE